jgi:hypothetical protein
LSAAITESGLNYQLITTGIKLNKLFAPEPAQGSLKARPVPQATDCKTCKEVADPLPRRETEVYCAHQLVPVGGKEYTHSIRDCCWVALPQYRRQAGSYFLLSARMH